MTNSFEDRVARIYWFKQQINGLETEIERIYSSLGNLENRSYPAGKFILQVTPTVRFDPALAERVLTKKEFASILKTKPDSALAKAMLGPDTYKATQKVYGQTRKIIPVEDEEDF